MTLLLRPVTKMKCSMPAWRASSTTCWMTGLSTTGSISLGIALVAGRNRVPRPATGMTALLICTDNTAPALENASVRSPYRCRHSVVLGDLKVAGHAPGIAPRGLGRIERRVGVAHQGRRAGAVGRKHRHANGNGDGERIVTLVQERPVTDDVTDSLGSAGG